MKKLTAALNERDRRALLLGATLITAAIALRAVPAAARSAGHLTARADAASLELARARELLDGRMWMRDSLAGRASRLVALAPRLVAGRTAAEVRAELGAIVAATAERHRIRVAQQEVRADSVAGPFLRVQLRLEGEGDVTGVAGWLAALEEGMQLLTVSEVSIQAPEPFAPPAQMERLRIVLTVAGWGAPRGQRP